MNPFQLFGLKHRKSIRGARLSLEDYDCFIRQWNESLSAAGLSGVLIPCGSRHRMCKRHAYFDLILELSREISEKECLGFLVEIKMAIGNSFDVASTLTRLSPRRHLFLTKLDNLHFICDLKICHVESSFICQYWFNSSRSFMEMMSAYYQETRGKVLSPFLRLDLSDSQNARAMFDLFETQALLPYQRG